MDQAKKTKLRSTIGAIIAMLVAFGPDIVDLFEVTDASPKWLKLAAKAVGVIVALCTTGKAVAILNKFLPDEKSKVVPPAAPLALVGLLLVSAMPACKTTPTNPDSFFQRVVTCTTENTHSNQAGAMVLGCLTGAAGGDYAACLSSLVTVGNWTVDEIACLVRGYATNAATRINSGAPMDNDSEVLKRANQWIRDRQLKFRSE